MYICRVGIGIADLIIFYGIHLLFFRLFIYQLFPHHDFAFYHLQIFPLCVLIVERKQPQYQLLHFTQMKPT